MERTDILELMSVLKLYGMRAAYDEVMTTGIKRRHEPPRIVGDLLSAEIAEKQARSIKYQLTIAKLPLAKDIEDFDFTGTPVSSMPVVITSSSAICSAPRSPKSKRRHEPPRIGLSVDISSRMSVRSISKLSAGCHSGR